MGVVLMKKNNFKLAAIGFIAMAIIMTTGSVFADGTNKTIDAVFGLVKLVVNGKQIEKETLLYDGRTYIPLRDAAETLGMEVAWDEKISTAYIDGVGTDRQAKIDGIEKPSIATPTPKPTPSTDPEPTPRPTPKPTPTPETDDYPCFEENKYVIDFGKMFGFPLDSKTNNRSSTDNEKPTIIIYTYYISDLYTDAYKEYWDALRSLGFVNTSGNQSDQSDFDPSRRTYTLEKGDTTVRMYESSRYLKISFNPYYGK